MNMNFVQDKEQHKELIETITSIGYYLRNVTLTYIQLMIARSKVYHRKSSVTLKLVQNFVNSHKEILILYGDIV